MLRISLGQKDYLGSVYLSVFGRFTLSIIVISAEHTLKMCLPFEAQRRKGIDRQY